MPDYKSTEPDNYIPTDAEAKAQMEENQKMFAPHTPPEPAVDSAGHPYGDEHYGEGANKTLNRLSTKDYGNTYAGSQ